MPERSDGPSAPASGPFDPLGHLAAFVSGPVPRILLVKGPSGSGKSILVRSLVERLTDSLLLIAYRTGPSDSGPPATADVSLLLVDRGRVSGAGGNGPDAPSTPGASVNPPRAASAEPLPEPIRAAIARLAETGSGVVVIDAWDRATEEAFRSLGNGTVDSAHVTSPIATLRAHLGRFPLHAIVTVAGPVDPGFDSVADGVLELGTEPLDTAQVRVLTVATLRGASRLDTHFLYSLGGGRFYTPTGHRPGYLGAAGPAEPEPDSQEGTSWPGSVAYARAFGRLRHHGLTAIEFTEHTAFPLADVLLLPMVASVVRSGGRVVWVPGGTATPARVAAMLGRFLPEEAIAQSVRVLSGSSTDAVAPALRPLVLVPKRAGPGAAARSSDPDRVVPLFPEAYQFLRDRRSEGPAMFLLSIDGLSALSTVTGNVYDPATFPLIISSYARLGQFHGIGYGRQDSPLTKAILPAVDVHLRAHEIYGRSVLVG
ncbi:MAG: ATP-binding protein, partial [Thermoplasmata archaeon]